METVSNENSISKDTDADESDLEVKLKKLADRLALHETEKQKMREEFGQQRAKMKEMFLQKEEELKRGSTEHNRLSEEIQRLQTELNDARTQVTVISLELGGRLDEERRRYQDEVASLQRLVTETVEESSRNDEEVQRLRRLNEKLETELDDLRHSSTSNVEGSSAQLLTAPGAMISTLARKVVSQLGADSSLSSTVLPQSQPSVTTVNENLEESMRKAQEDAEVLRSLVIPLEEEIKALKDKLRRNDELLCRYQQVDDSHPILGIVGSSSKPEQAADETVEFNIGGGDSELKSAVDGDGKMNISFKIGQEQPGDISLTMMNYSSQTTDSANTSNNAVRSPLPVSLSNSSLLLIDVTNEDTSNSSVIAPVCDIEEPVKICNMCVNYKAQLATIQEKCKELERQVTTLERCKEESAKEALIRKDMEQKWNEKKEIHKAEVNELQAKVSEATTSLKDIQELFKTTKAQVTEQLNRLSSERKNVQIQLDRLQLENENLIGKRNATARVLQDEIINLPDNVEELQEMLLRCREDLISARVGQEAAEQEVGNLKEQAQLQMYQNQAENQSRQHLKDSLTVEIESLKSQLHKSDMSRHQVQVALKASSDEKKSMRLEIEDLNVQRNSAMNAKRQLEEQVNELKSSLSSLQAELHNSEIVQKDFVRLSQSLQQELERIRSSHTQLRWEHEEDIDQCPGCRQTFTATRHKKQHCRHCGRIFCSVCLTRTVLSGPNQRPSKVCDVCHTLLVEDTAPYFSTEPPHSNN